MKIFLSIFVIFSSFLSIECYAGTLLMYIGVASKPPMQKLIAIYHKKTGTNINVIYGGSGTLLSDMILTKIGDIYMPASPGFMSIAEKKGVVIKNSVKKIAYLVPALIVPKNNPKDIHSYADLAKPGVHIVIANPETVSIGKYAAEIIDKALNKANRLKIHKNILNYAGSASKAAIAVALHQADAAIDWRVYSYLNSKFIKAINIDKYIVRISYISAGISNFTKNIKEARRFMNFLSSPVSRIMFKKYHIAVNLNEVYKSIGRKVVVGGSYKLSKSWLDR